MDEKIIITDGELEGVSGGVNSYPEEIRQLSKTIGRGVLKAYDEGGLQGALDFVSENYGPASPYTLSIKGLMGSWQ